MITQNIHREREKMKYVFFRILLPLLSLSHDFIRSRSRFRHRPRSNEYLNRCLYKIVKISPFDSFVYINKSTTKMDKKLCLLLMMLLAIVLRSAALESYSLKGKIEFEDDRSIFFKIFFSI